MDDESLEPKLLEEIFKFEVFKNEQGGYVLASSKDRKKGFVDLTNFMQKYTESDVEVIFGSGSACKTFCVAVLKWPRKPAAKYMWSTKS
eukprot:3710187-Heterocapsa_arctica.AAC.1